jgi:hypothetical protein
MKSLWMVCVFALLLGCSEGGGVSGDGGAPGTGGTGGEGGARIDPSPYADKDLWLCSPDMENDYCDTADLSTTEIHGDGTRVERPGPAMDRDAPFDCFVVHSTGNDILEPGNIETISPPNPDVLNRILTQGAPFRGSCRIFAPAYHAMTIGTYDRLLWDETEYFQRAYADVADAFEYYMRNHNTGRDMVLIGMSQGSHMLTRLLEEKFDNDETLRGQLISALLMGMSRLMYVPTGELVGGNLENIPLCSSRNETGCVIAYEPWADLSDTGQKIIVPTGSADACVNPASLDDSTLKATMAAFWFMRSSAGEQYADVTTEWIYMPEVLTSQCVGSRLVLRVSDGDPRTSPDVIRDNAREDGNIHGWSTSAGLADLIEVIAEQASAR